MLYFRTLGFVPIQSTGKGTRITHMEHLEQLAFETVRNTWARAERMYALKTACPMVKLNARLKTTAGRCDFETRIIDLSTSLFLEHTSEFENIIIPHEVAHQIAFDIFKDNGHGTGWKQVMLDFGLQPERCHHLVNSAHEKAKGNTVKQKIWKTANSFIVGDVCSWEHKTGTITGTVIRVNTKTITMVDRITRKEWRVPFLNTCNLRHA